MHYVAHAGFADAVGRFLDRERAHVGDTIDLLRERGPLKAE
jgi:predicted N-acyltransferase